MRNVVLIIAFILGGNFIGVFSATGSQPVPGGNIVTIEIRYFAPEAGVVNFVWGIDGWKPIAEELRVENIDIQNNRMVLPMRREDETFVTEVRVPAGSSVQYGFSVKETADGRSVDVWDEGKDPERGRFTGQPILIASYDRKFYVAASTNLDRQFVTQEFLYRHSETDHVNLVWWVINGQDPTVPEAANEVDTTILNNRMHTQMERADDNFQTSIQVPKGSRIQYGFSHIKREDIGVKDRIWDGGYTFLANEDGSMIEIDPGSAHADIKPGDDSTNENIPFGSLFSKHWPLLLIGIITILGILIGFRKS